MGQAYLSTDRAEPEDSLDKAAALGVLGFLLLLATTPLAAQQGIVQSPIGSAGLALVPIADGYRVEDLAGVRATLAVSPGTRLTAIAELAGGWIATGARLVSDGAELVLWLNDGSSTRAIGEPGERFAFRRDPLALVEKGRLAAVAWLEGDGGENNAVAVARRIGESWETVQTVSPLTGAAQLALSGAVLDDGSWLLVWAAVDGEDEEILWSRFDGTAWSSPTRLHPDNSVADIVPAVAAVKSGAVAAWSQFDGKDYRLKIAGFDGEGWHDTGFVGEKGSLYPTAFPSETGVGFLYQTVIPRTWSLVVVSSGGRLARRAATARISEPRPVVVSTQADSVALRFASVEPEASGAGRASIETRLEWLRAP